MLLLLLGGMDSYAAGRWYQVELIVFKQSGATTEHFYQTAHRIVWPGRLVELSGYASLQTLQARPVSYTKIKSSDWTMHWPERQLKRAGGLYAVAACFLAAAGGTQPAEQCRTCL